LIALQVEYLQGPNAGRKILLRDTCVTFGRSTERTLPLDLSFASREHGQFNYDNGKWLLTNLSNNGTKLNGKQVTNKPRTIKGTCTITIGDDDVFRVRPIADPASDQSQTDSDDQAPPLDPTDDESHTTNTNRTKLWFGIGALWFVVFGFIAFAILNPADPNASNPALNLPPPFTPDRIQQILARPMSKSTPDQRQADLATAQAHEFYALIDRRHDALFRAFDAYRLALSFSPNDTFTDAQDQRQFYVLQKRLTQSITTQYESASQLLMSRQYKLADFAFKELRKTYPDPASPIFTDALKREAAARDALKNKQR
jgi:pSer/pThr/pTyr-binding forkhead associated (FHA) protein